MAELPEQGNYVASSERDPGSEEMIPMYQAVIKDTREDTETEGNDAGDMYRVAKSRSSGFIKLLPFLVASMLSYIGVSSGNGPWSYSRPLPSPLGRSSLSLR